MKKRRRHPPKIPFFYIMILYIVSNAIREDVLGLYLLHVEAVLFHKVPEFLPAIGIGDRAAGFRLGITRD